MAKHEMSDIIVVLPGILGSVLSKDGRKQWALSPGAVLRGLLSLGRNIKDLAVVDDDPEKDDLGDGVTASGLMPDVHFAPGLWKIDGYSKMTKMMRSAFDVHPGLNYFEFPYDWRRDLRPTARLLRRQTAKWLALWRQRSGNQSAKIIFLAHSMGGLLARQFIECEEDGLGDTKTLITLGTPFGGSLNALNFLANGLEKGLGPVKLLDLSEFLRSLTSVYQLLPTYPCYDPGDGRLRRVGDVADIPHVDPERAADALAFHSQITKRAKENQGAYGIRPIVGINQPTAQGARFDGRDGVIVEQRLAGEDLSGDGTVPRPSAIPAEWEREEEYPISFSSAVHSSIQNSAGALTQIQGILTGGYDREKYREAVDVELSMDLRDWIDPTVGGELKLKARPVFEKSESSKVRIDIENVDAPAALPQSFERVLPPAEWISIDLPQLPEGVYRARVESLDLTAMPLSDIFAVISEA